MKIQQQKWNPRRCYLERQTVSRQESLKDATGNSNHLAGRVFELSSWVESALLETLQDLRSQNPDLCEKTVHEGRRVHAHCLLRLWVWRSIWYLTGNTPWYWRDLCRLRLEKWERKKYEPSDRVPEERKGEVSRIFPITCLEQKVKGLSPCEAG